MASTIGASVGRGGTNDPADVQVVRDLLRRHAMWLIPLQRPVASGPVDDVLVAQITQFQIRACSLLKPTVSGRDDTGGWRADGVVDPVGFTFRRLSLPSIAPLRNVVFTSGTLRPTQRSLTDVDYAKAAKRIGCEIEAIKSVGEVEAGEQGSFNEFGKPTILYERHKFGDRTNWIYSRSHPGLSGPYRVGQHGLYRLQYSKLGRAAVFDEKLALESCSWGLFQLMGYHHEVCGYPDVQGYVTAMTTTVVNHLDAFASFILGNPTLTTAIIAKDWTTFARSYNGKNYRDNAYDTKMAAAYRRLKAAAGTQ